MSAKTKIAFVCLHGSAKSLIAAEYLNRRAGERGFKMSATSTGPEPDLVVPSNVIEGLRRHDIDVGNRTPERVSARSLSSADHIVSFGCDLHGLVAADRDIERWDDCPAVSDDFDVAWSFITARVEKLIDRLRN